jgi:hypothetical protein
MQCDGADRQHRAGDGAGVGRQGDRTEPRQQRHGQQREASLAEQRSGGQREPGRAGVTAALGQGGAGHDHRRGHQHPGLRRPPRQQRSGDAEQHRRAADHQPDHGRVGAPDRADHAQVEGHQPAGGERQQQPGLAQGQARQAAAGGPPRHHQDDRAGGVAERLAAHHRVVDQQAGGGHGRADHGGGGRRGEGSGSFTAGHGHQPGH